MIKFLSVGTENMKLTCISHLFFKVHYVHSTETVNYKTGSTLCNKLHHNWLLFILNSSTCAVSLAKSYDVLVIFNFCYKSYVFSMICASLHLIIIIPSNFDVCQLVLLNLPLYNRFMFYKWNTKLLYIKTLKLRVKIFVYLKEQLSNIL